MVTFLLAGIWLEKIKDFHNQHKPKHSEQNSDTVALLNPIPFRFLSILLNSDFIIYSAQLLGCQGIQKKQKKTRFCLFYSRIRVLLKPEPSVLSLKGSISTPCWICLIWKKGFDNELAFLLPRFQSFTNLVDNASILQIERSIFQPFWKPDCLDFMVFFFDLESSNFGNWLILWFC